MLGLVPIPTHFMADELGVTSLSLVPIQKKNRRKNLSGNIAHYS